MTIITTNKKNFYPLKHLLNFLINKQRIDYCFLSFSKQSKQKIHYNTFYIKQNKTIANSNKSNNNIDLTIRCIISICYTFTIKNRAFKNK